MSSLPRHRYLFWCASEHQNFRIPEFESLSRLFNIELTWVERNEQEPWVILQLKSEEEARTLLTRCVSAKYAVELWADADSYDGMHGQLREFPVEKSAPYCGEEQSFKIQVDVYMSKLSFAQRLERIESFDYMPMKGPVKLERPDVVFSNCEFWGLDQNNLSSSPQRLFFGRCVGEGQRELRSKLNIKKRKFIGNTTMDPTLALLAANLASVRPATLVLDPFVGTGSLLLAAAQFGAHVIGGDIDFLMLHARTRPSRVGQKVRAVDESVRANFTQYGLESHFLDVVVCDASRPPWRGNARVAAIVTDPPYGIREPTERIGTNRPNPKAVPEEYLQLHHPQKVEYGLSAMYTDLVSFAAERLEEGGRVAFWVPISREEYSEEKLPSHPRLRMVANCEQILSCHTSRRLLVMEKLMSTEPNVVSKSSACDIVPESTATFRENFYSASDLHKKEKKERLKKYGHLNLKGDNNKIMP